MYEMIAIDCARKLRGSRIVDLVRALNDHQIPMLSIAGVLVRLAFLRYGSRVVMRNPLIVAEYFASLITGDDFDPGFDIDLVLMEESINTAINKASYVDFSFLDAMRGHSDS